MPIIPNNKVFIIDCLNSGIGYGMVIISGMVCIYYNIIITWTFYYLFKSMQKVLPWSLCGQSWNTEWCVEEGAKDSNSTLMANGTVSEAKPFLNVTISNATSVVASNLSAVADNDTRSKTSSEEFWR